MMLLEGLVAILIFSLGVMSIVKLQAVSIQQSTAAEYRSVAALLANDLVSRMWASDKTAATLQSNFASANNGSGYSSWLSSVQSSGLPNVSATKNTLPTVTFSTVAGGGTAPTSSSKATITVFWVAPGDSNVHSYVAVAQLK